MPITAPCSTDTVPWLFGVVVNFISGSQGLADVVHLSTPK